MTRYFMTIPEAVSLVLQAGAMASQRKVFLLDMGEPVSIIDLARQMIRLAGLRPDHDIAIEIIGLRPGERLQERLHDDAEILRPGDHPSISGLEPKITLGMGAAPRRCRRARGRGRELRRPGRGAAARRDPPRAAFRASSPSHEIDLRAARRALRNSRSRPRTIVTVHRGRGRAARDPRRPPRVRPLRCPSPDPLGRRSTG